MADYLIIDSHVHTYQTREIGLQAKQGGGATDYAGTVEELLPALRRAGVSQAVMVNMLPLAEMKEAAVAKLPADLSTEERDRALAEVDARMLGRLERRNTWTCGVAAENPSLIAFINLDPLQDEATMTAELTDKVENRGARGVKLHPSSQQFYPGDRRLWPGYRLAQEMGLPVIFHSGTFASAEQYARPKYFVDVLASFPDLTVVMAHIGQGYLDEVRSLAADYPNLQFDCSAIVSNTAADGAFTDKDLTALIRDVGVERVMFGSDFPWYDPADSVERLRRLDFSDEENRLLLAQNAIRIYGLDED